MIKHPSTPAIHHISRRQGEGRNRLPQPGIHISDSPATHTLRPGPHYPHGKGVILVILKARYTTSRGRMAGGRMAFPHGRRRRDNLPSVTPGPRIGQSADMSLRQLALDQRLIGWGGHRGWMPKLPPPLPPTPAVHSVAVSLLLTSRGTDRPSQSRPPPVLSKVV